MRRVPVWSVSVEVWAWRTVAPTSRRWDSNTNRLIVNGFNGFLTTFGIFQITWITRYSTIQVFRWWAHWHVFPDFPVSLCPCARVCHPLGTPAWAPGAAVNTTGTKFTKIYPFKDSKTYRKHKKDQQSFNKETKRNVNLYTRFGEIKRRACFTSLPAFD